MQPTDIIWKRAPRLALTTLAVVACSLTCLVPRASAQATTDYTAQQIEDWLVDKIAGATLDLSAATVSLSSEFDYMDVSGVTLSLLGINVGLSPLRLNFDDELLAPSTDTDITATFALFDIEPEPRIQCTATLSCIGPGGNLEVADLSGISIGSYAPALSTEDTDSIRNVINDVITASGLTVSPPSATLTGICVVDDAGTDKVRLTWSDASVTLLDAAYLQGKINGMLDTMETKANTYLNADEAERDWWVDLEIPVTPGDALHIDAGLSAFGVTASIDADLTFAGMTATLDGTELAIGSRSITFAAETDISCSSYIPSIQTAHFTLNPGDGPPWSGLDEYVNVTIQERLVGALDDAFDDIRASIGLQFPYPSVSQIEVTEEVVRFHEAGTITVPLELRTGWNLVSIPVTPADAAVEVVFPDKVVVYTWTGGACVEVVDGTDVIPGQGYWVAMATDDLAFQFEGAPLASGQTLPLAQGWNMVGVATATAVGDLETAEPDTGQLLTDYIYSWNTSGKTYGTPVSELLPGKGYWLACSEACTLVIS